MMPVNHMKPSQQERSGNRWRWWWWWWWWWEALECVSGKVGQKGWECNTAPTFDTWYAYNGRNGRIGGEDNPAGEQHLINRYGPAISSERLQCDSREKSFDIARLGFFGALWRVRVLGSWNCYGLWAGWANFQSPLLLSSLWKGTKWWWHLFKKV